MASTDRKRQLIRIEPQRHRRLTPVLNRRVPSACDPTTSRLGQRTKRGQLISKQLSCLHLIAKLLMGQCSSVRSHHDFRMRQRTNRAILLARLA